MFPFELLNHLPGNAYSNKFTKHCNRVKFFFLENNLPGNCIIFLNLHLKAQAVISRPAFAKSILDFGAKPNDGKDDTWAFIKAGKYFSNLWDINGVPLPKGKQNFSYDRFSGLLTIPSGTYLAGKQIDLLKDSTLTTYGSFFGYPPATAALPIAGALSYKVGLQLMVLTNVDQFVIKGTGAATPVIKYNDGLIIGYFNRAGKPMTFPKNKYDGAYSTAVGNFLSAYDCKNIVMENLNIDGNNISTEDGGKTFYNGGWVRDLIQSGASGAYLENTQNVTIRNLSIHHMTLDGIVFRDFYKDTLIFLRQPLSNLLIENTNCDYNRRQGLSWVGGRKIVVKNSSFSHTGTTVSGLAAGNPGAGVDIEAEDDGKNELFCLDGSFTNCEFVNNIGCALVNDLSWTRTRNVRLSSCKFHDVTGYSVWVKGRAFSFSNCKIWVGLCTATMARW